MKPLLFKITVPLLIVLVGIIAGSWFVKNPEEAQKRLDQEEAFFLVETDTAEAGDFPATIEVMGQVRPSMQAALKAQISGEIIDVNSEFLPGGIFKKGEVILMVDPVDYELNVQKQQAILKQAEADYKLEMGRQSVARDELNMLKRTTGEELEDSTLALRTPQLEQAHAEIEKTESDFDLAWLNLERTIVTAPFNALVIERQATLGDKISAQDTVAMIVNTDMYWVEISVPVTDLYWLHIPTVPGAKGSKASVTTNAGHGRKNGYLLKLTGAMDEKSRMANLLVAVPDPLSQDDSLPLLLNDYVSVILEGKKMKDVVRVPIPWVRDGNIVYTVKNGTMHFQPIVPVYEDRNYVYIKDGLSGGEQIVTSNVPVPMDGMKVRTMEEARAETQKKMKGPKGPKDSTK